MRREHNELYRDVEKLKPVNGCYVDTGITTSTGTTQLETEFKIQFKQYDISRTIIRSYPNAGLQVYTNKQLIVNQTSAVPAYDNELYTIYTNTTATIRRVKILEGRIMGNIDVTLNFSRSITDNQPICLFCTPELPTLNFIDYFYYLKLWRNGVLVRDYVCKQRLSDSVYGLYDNVTGSFETGEVGYFSI